MSRAVSTLLVEERPADADRVRARLSEIANGAFEVTWVKTLAEASTTVDVRVFDLLIVDLELPDSRGIDTLTHMRRLRPHIPIVVVADGMDDRFRMTAMANGADEVIAPDDIQGRLFFLGLLHVMARHRTASTRPTQNAVDAGPESLLIVDEGLLLFDRMLSIGSLAAGFTHEINNPLAAVIGNLELSTQKVGELSQQGTLPAAVLEELAEARYAADRVHNIVRDLKIFARAQDTRTGPVDVQRVLDAALRMAGHAIRPRARLVKEYSISGLPRVAANEARLAQVFLSLILNAAESIPEGNPDDNEVRVETGLDDRGRITVAIRDTGRGIPAEVRPRLFTPFFTTKPYGTGAGLGLAISRSIVDSLNGEISFTSGETGGTRFLVTLPGARFGTTISERNRVAPKSVAALRARVLVIDDEAMIVQTVKRMLQRDHDVTGAASAEEALLLLGEGSRFHVILCDMMMPMMTGIDFHREARALGSDIERRIIFMTGGAFTPECRGFLDAVANHRIEKPFDLRELRTLIAGFLN